MTDQTPDVELLPSRLRVDDDLDRYPNQLTLASIEREIRARIADGFIPVQAFLTVSEGVANWLAQEKERS